jgi:phage baseplate assembly protein W
VADTDSLNESRNFLGTGWAFPLAADGRGGIALAVGEQAIERSIELILSTRKGERRMRPEFGCGIHDLVFAPNDATMVGLIRYYVTDALGMWEPRIEVVDVSVTTSPDDPGQVLIDVHYVIKATSDERSLVYPFYVIPGEE